MNITKAYCVELRRSINITEARNTYFALGKPRRRFEFHCSSPECRQDDSAPVVISGVNYDKIATDHPRFKTPHFRSVDIDAHSQDCGWIIDEDARKLNAKVKSTQGDIAKSSNNREGLIKRSTFLSTNKTKLKVGHSSDDMGSADKHGSEEIGRKSRSQRVRSAQTRLERGLTSSSFSDLVSAYLEVFHNNAWDTPLEVIDIPTTTYGKFFKKIEWYTEKSSKNHAFYGSVKLAKIYPSNFDFSNGVPSAVNLRFEQEVTLDGVTAKPTLYIQKEQFKGAPSAHVLAEAIEKISTDKNYFEHLWCHFYGHIQKKEVHYKDGNGKNVEFTTLEVIPLSLETVELILRERTSSSHDQ